MICYPNLYVILLFTVLYLLIIHPLHASENHTKILNLGYTPVITPNGTTLPYEIENGVKVFHLIAEKIKREFTPGFMVDCWGYNGQTPGPTIEAVEGDRVRILVTNKAPEPTSVHWHGLFLPNGMDGVGGLTQRYIKPGETYAYEFDLVQNGTFMYHPHADEAVQIAMGMEGFFIIHPKETKRPEVDRDYAIFLHMWQIKPGTSKPNPNAMLDFNYFSFNSRVYPGTSPLVAQRGERVRIRFANLSMESHPIHIHGVSFKVTATEGGDIPENAQTPTTTVNVPPGTVKIIEFVPEYAGDWPMHCHKTHHAMNAMEHHIPNMIGVAQGNSEKKIRELLPGYMAMGEAGMHDMQDHAKHMPGVKNTPPMMAGDGPFGNISMGGMFTVFKVREVLPGNDDPGWYDHPPGTVASPIKIEDDDIDADSDRDNNHTTTPNIRGATVHSGQSEPKKNKLMPPSAPDLRTRPETTKNIVGSGQNESATETIINAIEQPLEEERSPEPKHVSMKPSSQRNTKSKNSETAKKEILKLTKRGPGMKEMNPATSLVINDFERKPRINRLGNKAGIRKQAPSKLLARIVEDTIDGRKTKVLRLRFHKIARGGPDGRGGFAKFYSNLKRSRNLEYFNADQFRYLSMWVKGKRGNENFIVGFRDRLSENSDDSARSKPITSYLNTPVLGSEWNKLQIPLSEIQVDPSSLASISINFESECFPNGEGRGQVYIDDIVFEN